jgi:hypothetical protein
MRIESKYKLANSSLTNISTLKPQNLNQTNKNIPTTTSTIYVHIVEKKEDFIN